MKMKTSYIFIGFLNICFILAKDLEEEKYGVIFASECEVCKLVTKEIGDLLSSKTSADIIELGYNIDSKKKKKKAYEKSELKLIETLEDTCEGMLGYKIHKERHDSTRWAKKMSETFKTLHGLVNKGVKVDLGIPYELWDEPSAEVSQLKTQCEQFLEDNEDIINDWYFGSQIIPPMDHICQAVLSDTGCITEPFGETILDSENDGKKVNAGSTNERTEL